MDVIVQIGTHNDPDSLERYRGHLKELAHGKYKGDERQRILANIEGARTRTQVKKAYRKEL